MSTDEISRHATAAPSHDFIPSHKRHAPEEMVALIEAKVRLKNAAIRGKLDLIQSPIWKISDSKFMEARDG